MSKSRNYQSPYDIACMYEFPMSKSCMCLLMHKPMPCDVMNSIAILMYESMEQNEYEFDCSCSTSRVASPILVGCPQEVVFLRDHQRMCTFGCTRGCVPSGSQEVVFLRVHQRLCSFGFTRGCTLLSTLEVCVPSGSPEVRVSFGTLEVCGIHNQLQGEYNPFPIKVCQLCMSYV